MVRNDNIGMLEMMMMMMETKFFFFEPNVVVASFRTVQYTCITSVPTKKINWWFVSACFGIFRIVPNYCAGSDVYVAVPKNTITKSGYSYYLQLILVCKDS